MPNVIDVEPIRAFAHRAAARISNDTVRARFERLAFERLLNDERSFRAAREHEIAAAPDWARRAIARGDAVVVFAVNRAAAQRIHNVARRLADACCVASADAGAHAGYGAYIAAAIDFVQKFERVNFEVAARKALLFSRVRLAWQSDGDSKLVCSAETVAATQGRTWSRICSISELRVVGRELVNCLSRAANTSSYGGALAKGHGQFWVLRDHRGAGLIVAYAARVTPTHFSEVKGPRNTPVSPDNPDLLRLADALGMKPRTPPRPPPSPAAAAATLNALLGQIERAPSQRARLIGNLVTPLRRTVATT